MVEGLERVEHVINVFIDFSVPFICVTLNYVTPSFISKTVYPFELLMDCPLEGNNTIR